MGDSYQFFCVMMYETASETGSGIYEPVVYYLESHYLQGRPKLLHGTLCRSIERGSIVGGGGV
jgi:hypothetical protein